jgi:hypothetical protein
MNDCMGHRMRPVGDERDAGGAVLAQRVGEEARAFGLADEPGAVGVVGEVVVVAEEDVGPRRYSAVQPLSAGSRWSYATTSLPRSRRSRAGRFGTA